MKISWFIILQKIPCSLFLGIFHNVKNLCLPLKLILVRLWPPLWVCGCVNQKMLQQHLYCAIFAQVKAIPGDFCQLQIVSINRFVIDLTWETKVNSHGLYTTAVLFAYSSLLTTLKWSYSLVVRSSMLLKKQKILITKTH